MDGFDKHTGRMYAYGTNGYRESGDAGGDDAISERPLGKDAEVKASGAGAKGRERPLEESEGREMRTALVALALVTFGCGSNPVAPSTSNWLAPSLPLPTTDARFDPAFFNELAHGTLEFPDAPPAPLHRLTQSPSVYLQRTGLSDAFVAQIEQMFREEIPAFTGGALTLNQFQSGEALKPDTSDWIVIELRTDDPPNCGATTFGLFGSHVQINMASRCALRGQTIPPAALFAHEMGHALGFYHVDAGLMQTYYSIDAPEQTLTDREKYHGAVAYTQAIGSK